MPFLSSSEYLAQSRTRVCGDTGGTGYTGYTGPQGIPGTSTNTGATGYTGYTGPQGPSGPAGSNGTNGTIIGNTGNGYLVWITGGSVQGNASITSDGASLFTTGNITAQGNVTAYSDSRMKRDIVTIDSALDKVINLRGVYYTKSENTDRREVGVIAQEIEKIIPEAVVLSKDGYSRSCYNR